MTPIRVLIVDDEPLARERVRSLLSTESDFLVVGESKNGREAIKDVRRHKPDLVFLDVQMPAQDGFEVIEEVGVEQMPVVIFVTAYDKHALRAFDVHALDYLLKPFDADRFLEALNRARRQISLRGSGDGELGRQLLSAIHELRPDVTYAKRLAIKVRGTVSFLPVDEIDWVEAAGNYVRLHAGGHVHQMRESLRHLEGRLDPAQFVRIHRSTLVNIACVREVQPMFHGDAVVILQDGSELPVSRNHRSNIAG